MTYTITFDNNNTAKIVADDLDSAMLQAYCAYGVDAIGMNITGDDNGDFCATVCRKVWDELLEDRFADFSINDVIMHLVLSAYAWATFEKETHFDYYEECEVISLGKEGLEYLKAHDRLGNYMDEIGWRW